MTTVHDHPAAKAPTTPPERETHFVELVTAGDRRASLCIRADKRKLRWGVFDGRTWHYREMDIEDVFNRHLASVRESLATSVEVVPTPEASGDET